MSDIILDILRRYVDGTKIKKASARSGGEYHSPCPKCGGTDRFCVFPEQPGGALAMQHGITGTWACPRHCQEGGDAIDLLTWAGGLTFREACEELRIDLPERTQEERRRYRPLRPLTAHGTDTWTPTSYASPPETWLTQATKLATEAHARLLETPSILSYLAKRGLPLEAVQRYGLGYIEGEDNTGKYLYRQRAAFGLPPKERDGKPVRALRIPRGITIPCWSDGGHTQALRVRIRKRNADLTEGEDKYILIAQPAPPYSAPLWLVPIGVAPELATWAVVESELDAKGSKIKIPGGVLLRRVDTTFFKGDLAEKLSVTPGDPGTFWLHANTVQQGIGEMGGILADYAKEMCAEVFSPDKLIWENPHQRPNHFWDCEVMALVCAWELGISNWETPEPEPAHTEPAPMAAPAVPMPMQRPAPRSLADRLARLRR